MATIIFESQVKCSRCKKLHNQWALRFSDIKLSNEMSVDQEYLCPECLNKVNPKEQQNDRKVKNTQ